MARLVTSGAEVRDHPTTNVGSPDGWSAGATATTTETTIVRGGTASWKCSGTAANTSFRAFPWTAPASGATVYARALVRVGTLPSTSPTPILRLLTSADVALVSARLNASGTLELWNDVGSAQIGSDTTLALATGTWYRVQLSVTIGAGAVDAASLKVVQDDLNAEEETVSGSSLTISDTHAARFRVGWLSAPGNTTDIYVDAVGVNDSTGTYENSWPGPGYVLLSKPVWTSWTAATSTDCSGTSPTTGTGENMADALNNTPPLGVADHTTAGHSSAPDQIRSTSTATVKLWCQTFAEVGAVGDSYQGLQLAGGLTEIGSGNTASTFHGDKVAQSFYVNGTIEAFALRIGVPATTYPADDLVIELVEDNSGVPSGSVIESWTWDPSTQPGFTEGIQQSAWVKFTLTEPEPAYRTLWIRLSRTVANDASIHYHWRVQTTEFMWPGKPSARERSAAWTTTIGNQAAKIYTSQGLRSPKAAQAWICHGEAIATGTKTYSVNMTIQPVAIPPTGTSGNVGNDVGAAGTYPSNWTWSATPYQYRPVPTSGGGLDEVMASPRLGLTLTSGSRFSLMCFAGVYFEVDEVYSSDWTQFQKTSDSSIWWGKQAVAETMYECGTDGLTIVTIKAGNWALYPSPQISDPDNFPTTLVEVVDETLQSSYTRV